MRGENDIRQIEVLHLLISKGGLGDSVARMPAVKYVLDNYKHVKTVRLFCQDYFVEVACHLLNSSKLEVHGYKDMPAILDRHPNTPGMQTNSDYHTTLRTHLTDHAFHTLVDVQPTATDKDYLAIRPEEITDDNALPTDRRYAVITTGFTAPVRELLPIYINRIARYLRSQGLEVVYLGKKENEFWQGVQRPTTAHFRDTEVEYELGWDLRDKTSLLEAAKIMGKAEVVVGLDNGLLHLAGCTDVPIVAGYTTVSSEHRMPYRNGRLGSKVYPVELTKQELSCTNCQTQMGLVFDYDFRRCYYGDYKCCVELNDDFYIEQIRRALNA